MENTREEQELKGNGNYEYFIKLIEEGTLENERLISENEKKSALKILNELEGHPIIRADKILNFCKKSINYKIY